MGHKYINKNNPLPNNAFKIILMSLLILVLLFFTVALVVQLLLYVNVLVFIRVLSGIVLCIFPRAMFKDNKINVSLITKPYNIS